MHLDRYKFTNIDFSIEVNVLIFMEMLFPRIGTKNRNRERKRHARAKNLHKDNIDVIQKIRLAFSC